MTWTRLKPFMRYHQLPLLMLHPFLEKQKVLKGQGLGMEPSIPSSLQERMTAHFLWWCSDSMDCMGLGVKYTRVLLDLSFLEATLSYAGSGISSSGIPNILVVEVSNILGSAISSSVVVALFNCCCLLGAGEAAARLEWCKWQEHLQYICTILSRLQPLPSSP